ncbi:MAG: hypothetical protein M1569_00435 [Candidatus Marsarchaeota archaeon]|nr:hypothetical protein [Candidatus Marsarchaeota archaeon]MCL5412859.1 hypothetical protein [Candidatus Marsarchaeota archaeon]
MAENAPWSDEIDPFVTDLDNAIGDKFGVRLKKLLSSPAEYADLKDISTKIKNMRAEADKYFDDLVAGLSLEQGEFTRELTDADALYNKIEQLLSSRAAIAKVPYIRPADMDLSLTSPEVIYVNSYNNGLEALIMKFINSSNYVANISSTYKKYNIGSWFFSGSKGHIISVKPPQSILVSIDNARDEISGLIDDIADIFVHKKPAKQDPSP